MCREGSGEGATDTDVAHSDALAPGVSGEEAAVDGEVGVGDAGGVVGQEEGHRGGDLPWLGGDAGIDGLHLVLARVADHRCANDAGLHFVDADAAGQGAQSKAAEQVTSRMPCSEAE